LYGEYLNKEALGGYGDFKTGGQVFRTTKYADELVLLAKEEAVLQGMNERLTEIGRCYAMKMNVEKYGDESLKATIPNTDYGRRKTAGECGIFQVFR